MPPSYQKAVIYKLRCENMLIKDHYIGSTTNLPRRINEHRANCQNPLNKEHFSPLYTFIRENGGWNKWNIDIIAHVVCNTRQELEKIEREYIQNSQNLLNQKVPGRSPKEYYQDNREKILESKRLYYELNSDKINEKKKKRYMENIDECRDKRRQYYQEHREEILANKKLLYAKKDDFKAQNMAYFELEPDHNGEQGRRVICACGMELCYGSLSLHRNTKRHRDFIDLVNSV